MPELPEVETMRRGAAVVEGHTIVSVERLHGSHRPIVVTPKPAEFQRRALGRKILAVERLGKRVVLRIDCNDRIVFEPRMSGIVLTANPPTTEHLRFQLDAVDADGVRRTLWYWDRRGLGSVRLFEGPHFEMQFEGIGPDALQITLDTLREKFAKTRRQIKPALMDQTLIAGIGNIYACEILHLARVHPQTRCSDVSNIKWGRIHRAIGEILHMAILHEGSTLSDGTYRTSLNKDGGFQNFHRVYDRENEICGTCGAARVKRIVQTQRATFFCSKCQRK